VVTEESNFFISPSFVRIAIERAMDCDEKLESRVLHASREDAAKTTMPATDGVSED
jgi:hypothetical protein